MELSDEREILPLRSHALVQGHLPMVVLEEQYPTVFFLGAGAWSKFCLSRGGLLHMPLKIIKKIGWDSAQGTACRAYSARLTAVRRVGQNGRTSERIGSNGNCGH